MILNAAGMGLIVFGVLALLGLVVGLSMFISRRMAKQRALRHHSADRAVLAARARQLVGHDAALLFAQMDVLRRKDDEARRERQQKAASIGDLLRLDDSTGGVAGGGGGGGGGGSGGAAAPPPAAAASAAVAAVAAAGAGAADALDSIFPGNDFVGGSAHPPHSSDMSADLLGDMAGDSMGMGGKQSVFISSLLEMKALVGHDVFQVRSTEILGRGDLDAELVDLLVSFVNLAHKHVANSDAESVALSIVNFLQIASLLSDDIKALVEPGIVFADLQVLEKAFVAKANFDFAPVDSDVPVSPWELSPAFPLPPSLAARLWLVDFVVLVNVLSDIVEESVRLGGDGGQRGHPQPAQRYLKIQPRRCPRLSTLRLLALAFRDVHNLREAIALCAPTELPRPVLTLNDRYAVVNALQAAGKASSCWSRLTPEQLVATPASARRNLSVEAISPMMPSDSNSRRPFLYSTDMDTTGQNSMGGEVNVPKVPTFVILREIHHRLSHPEWTVDVALAQIKLQSMRKHARSSRSGGGGRGGGGGMESGEEKGRSISPIDLLNDSLPSDASIDVQAVVDRLVLGHEWDAIASELSSHIRALMMSALWDRANDLKSMMDAPIDMSLLNIDRNDMDVLESAMDDAQDPSWNRRLDGDMFAPPVDPHDAANAVNAVNAASLADRFAQDSPRKNFPSSVDKCSLMVRDVLQIMRLCQTLSLQESIPLPANAMLEMAEVLVDAKVGHDTIGDATDSVRQIISAVLPPLPPVFRHSVTAAVRIAERRAIAHWQVHVNILRQTAMFRQMLPEGSQENCLIGVVGLACMLPGPPKISSEFITVDNSHWVLHKLRSIASGPAAALEDAASEQTAGDTSFQTPGGAKSKGLRKYDNVSVSLSKHLIVRAQKHVESLLHRLAEQLRSVFRDDLGCGELVLPFPDSAVLHVRTHAMRLNDDSQLSLAQALSPSWSYWQCYWRLAARRPQLKPVVRQLVAWGVHLMGSPFAPSKALEFDVDVRNVEKHYFLDPFRSSGSPAGRIFDSSLVHISAIMVSSFSGLARNQNTLLSTDSVFLVDDSPQDNGASTSPRGHRPAAQLGLVDLVKFPPRGSANNAQDDDGADFESVPMGGRSTGSGKTAITDAASLMTVPGTFQPDHVITPAMTRILQFQTPSPGSSVPSAITPMQVPRTPGVVTSLAAGANPRNAASTAPRPSSSSAASPSVAPVRGTLSAAPVWVHRSAQARTDSPSRAEDESSSVVRLQLDDASNSPSQA